MNMSKSPPYTPSISSFDNMTTTSVNNQVTNSTSLFDSTTNNSTLLLDDIDSFVENGLVNNFSNINTNDYRNVSRDGQILTPITPSSEFSSKQHNILKDVTFDSNQQQNLNEEIDTPTAPVTPIKFNCPTKKYTRYPLRSTELSNFVLSPQLFNLKLIKRIGKGSNSYVYESKLSTNEFNPNSLKVATKIPSSKNKVKYIEQETEFMLRLKEYQSEWFKNYNQEYPFIDCYGLYYLNKGDFNMLKNNDELPCLLLKEMDIDLLTYIKSQSQVVNETKITPKNWWKLCRTLVSSLLILKQLNSVHCDFKTENILVSLDELQNPEFKVIDFSSASNLDNLTKLPDMTLQFTPPELLNFNNKKLPNFDTDLFSCGLILLNAATGQLPYANYTFDQFYLISLVKEGKVLDTLTREEINILDNNPIIYHLIKMILVDRCTLEDVITYVESCPHDNF